MKQIYIVGLQESGRCCMLGASDIYEDFDTAKQIVDAMHANGQTYMKVFTVYPQTADSAKVREILEYYKGLLEKKKTTK